MQKIEQIMRIQIITIVEKKNHARVARLPVFA